VAAGSCSGWAATEFAALGGDHAGPGETTDAYLEVITAAWAQEKGQRRLPGLRFTDAATGPRLRGGRVSVWAGGLSARAIRRAARFAIAWYPINLRLGWLQDRGLPALAIRRAACLAIVWYPINLRLGWLQDWGLPALRRAAAARRLGVGVGCRRGRFGARRASRSSGIRSICGSAGCKIGGCRRCAGPRLRGGRVSVWAGGLSARAIRRAACLAIAWYPINLRLGWLQDRGLPALRRAAAEAGPPMPELVPRIKARLRAEPAGAGRPLGVGNLDQVAGHVLTLERPRSSSTPTPTRRGRGTSPPSGGT
jgi:alkanesulfonate monooxygenase SsuD/methylene tetrahydromethanopterin reductase-like flavin-dependent oxidoreductase (luciferase family)